MHKPAFSAPQVAGLLVGLLGAITAVRWVFQVDAITRLIPGSEHLGIVNPLLFIAAGLCFFIATHRPRQDPASGTARGTWPARLSATCIAALVALPAAYLFESATGIALGIDIVRTGTVATAANPHPGRLSPNGSLAFLLTGVAFWLHGRRATRAGQIGFLAAVVAISGIGLSGLVGHFVGLESLYQLASFNRMLPSTALGLSVVGAGLWTLHEASQPFDPEALHRSERRIKRRSIAVLTLVALAGGVAGFGVMRDTFERSVSQNILLTATTNATSLAHAIEVSLWFPKTVATRPAVRQTLDELAAASDPAHAEAFLQKVADSLVTADLTGVEIHDANGARLAHAGSMVRPRALVVQSLTNAGQTAFLVWKDGYVLCAQNEVVVNGRIVGRVLTEQRMPLFDQLLADVRASSESSDVAVCGRQGNEAICAPNWLRPAGFVTPMFDANGAPGIPVTRALLGERGVKFHKDRRGINVVSAYAPIKDFGLGLAVKTDADSLYAPLRARLNLLALALVGIVALAIYAQHSQVRPLLKQLVASERRIKAILEDQTELVCLAKPDGELTYANPAYARHFGSTPAEMVGENLFDHVAPPDRENVRRLIAQVMSTGETTNGENRMVTPHGAERWLAWTNRLQHDPSGQPMLHSVGRDVTERKLAELALRTSQALLVRMGRVAGVGAWELDLFASTLKWNDETRRLHEVGPDFTPTLETSLAFYPRESRPAIEAAIRAGRERGEPWTLELPLVTASGRQIWVRTQGEAEYQDGRPARLVGAIQDITEQMLAERGLRALTAVFDATTDYVVQLDTKGRITYMNPAARRRTGIAADAAINHLTLADFNPPHTLERFISEVGPAAVATGVWVGESLVWDAERREFPVSHIVIAHRDQHGEVEYFSGLMRDISAAKAAEQAMRESEHRLRMVTDNLPVLICYLDRDLRFRFANRTYQEWFGHDAGPRIGSSVQAFYGDQAWAEIEPRLRAALEGEEVTYEREMVHAAGRRHVKATIVPDRDEQGRVVGLYALTSDVSSYRDAQRALQESEARLRTVADALPMRVAYIDAEERYRFNNLAYERGFGRRRQDLYGLSVRELLGDTVYQTVEPHIRNALRGQSVTFQSEMASGGSYVCYEAHYIPQLAADDSTVLGFHAVISDITRQKLEERRLIELARVDPLTGVVNRAGFELRVAEAMQRSRATGGLMALMYLDIDRFKQINDRFGHDTGDELLQAFARRLSQTLRSSDIIARLGGDEFTVIMEGLPRPEVAGTVANKIVQAMNVPFAVGPQSITVTTSIGLAFYQGDATTVDALVKQADVMLYQAKGAGRNNVQVALRLIEGGRA